MISEFYLVEKDFHLSNVSENECTIYRYISVVFISITILSFIINIRLILIDRNQCNPLALSLVINSLVLTCLNLPYVIIQSITCYPVRSYFICSLQDFAYFTCSISVMYTMCLLALIQYIKLFYNSSIIYRIIKHRKNFLIPILCWFISFLCSLPPYMNNESDFISEEYGFDCGLNWKFSRIHSRLYIYLAFIFIYFLPLFSILYTNIRILIKIRQLINRRYSVESQKMTMTVWKNLINIFTVAEHNRLRIDRRFTQATMITILHYLLAWTPFSICGMIQLFLSINSSQYKLPSMILTTSALIAKMSVIGQASIYYFAIRPLNRRFSLTLK